MTDEKSTPAEQEGAEGAVAADRDCGNGQRRKLADGGDTGPNNSWVTSAKRLWPLADRQLLAKPERSGRCRAMFGYRDARPLGPKIVSAFSKMDAFVLRKEWVAQLFRRRLAVLSHSSRSRATERLAAPTAALVNFELTARRVRPTGR